MTRPSEQARIVDTERLREGFFRAFDRSRLEALMRQTDRDLEAKATRIGEGAHFRAWRLKPQAVDPGHPAKGKGPVVDAVDLVLKRATPGMGKAGDPGERQWVDAMARLKGLGSLIPPFELLDGADGVGIVMPFGADPLGAAAPHWQPLEARVDELRQALAKRGLALMDVPQGRCWNGVPFLYDLSDVSRINF